MCTSNKTPVVFSSILFIFGFLPIFLLLYFSVPGRFKNYIALAASCFFYAWGAPLFIFVLIGTSFLDYQFSLLIQKYREQPKQKKLVLICSLIMNLSILFYFKYFNFFVSQYNWVADFLGTPPLVVTRVLLPIGISFFTFQEMTYMIDVYRGNAPKARSYFDFLLYIVLFPQLIAGPIVRYHDVALQLRQRTHTPEKALYGVFRFSIGLAKKVILANPMGFVADSVFALPAPSLTFAYSWLGITCYAFQIYFDFSGYSDMAIGLGKIMGFDFLENFNRPYLSRTITEFWRRWHISLSNFMKEYLYIPLGGNQGSTRRTYINLWIVFFLSGLWHGADWVFVIWGLYHGLLLTIEKMFWLRIEKRLPAIVGTVITFLLVLIGWVWFRSHSASQAVLFLSRMSNPFYVADVPVLWATFLKNRTIFTLVISFLICFVPSVSAMQPALAAFQNRIRAPQSAWMQLCSSLALFLLSVMVLSNSDFNPFIYYRF